MKLDHLAISCETLAQGAAFVKAALGVSCQPGGQHAHFGTHNMLLSLGPEEYLEIIAIDLTADQPKVPRWFDLDRFSGAPRLTNWILRADDITQIDPAFGAPVALSRGDLNWQMAVPDSGRLPFDNLHPAALQWQSSPPAPRLTDRGIRLTALSIQHPQADRLKTSLPSLDPRITFAQGAPTLSARFATPTGERIL